MRTSTSIARIAATLILMGAGFQTLAQSTATATAATAPSTGSQGGAYCVATGGLVETREAVFGTNNPPREWLMLAAVENFCQYTGSDGSRIHLSLLTLNATKPTLAALAYYAAVPWNGVGNGNPASFYCTQLGGAEIGATDAGGGAWVATGGVDQILETCIFPDNSTIDSWGLLYHSYGTIRGIDLATVLIYQNPDTPKSGN